MAVPRFRGLLPAPRVYESLWSKSPPSFLAPLLSSSSSFSTTTAFAANMKRVKKQDHRDSYALRQVKQRKDANLSRQAILGEQRVKELGDPIRGIPTNFVKSFDTGIPQDVIDDIDAAAAKISVEATQDKPDEPPPSPAHASREEPLDHGLTHDELTGSLEFSRMFTEPISGQNLADPEREEAKRQAWETRDRVASEAVQRIVSLANTSNMRRTKKNIERIVGTLGRHNTDQILKPKAPATITRKASAPVLEPTPRVGPDTGSSEVQIGILTAKIRVLADRYEGQNRNDKVNKRNLRLLLHRRQKLLKYMERKERGSERWQNMIGTLGLTPATWKGEINVH